MTNEMKLLEQKILAEIAQREAQENEKKEHIKTNQRMLEREISNNKPEMESVLGDLILMWCANGALFKMWARNSARNAGRYTLRTQRKLNNDSYEIVDESYVYSKDELESLAQSYKQRMPACKIFKKVFVGV